MSEQKPKHTAAFIHVKHLLCPLTKDDPKQPPLPSTMEKQPRANTVAQQPTLPPDRWQNRCLDHTRPTQKHQ